MIINQELKQAISELRGMTTFEQLRDFMVASMTAQLEPEGEVQEVISEEVAAFIATMTSLKFFLMEEQRPLLRLNKRKRKK